ncbi:uncharacterized protein LOC144862811 isoform X2 [Branchiostoma floridae x Branchiostoma japonicum]
MKVIAWQVATVAVLAMMLTSRGQEVEAPPEATAAHERTKGEEFNNFLSFLFGPFVGLAGRKPVGPKKWRNDYQCGPGYPAEDGNPAECDPDGIFPCCAVFVSVCGSSALHCDCPDCIDYREQGSGSASGSDNIDEDDE